MSIGEQPKPRPRRKKEWARIFEIIRDYEITSPGLVLSIHRLIELNSFKDQSSIIEDVISSLHSVIYENSSAARFIWRYQQGKTIFYAQDMDELYENYLEWCATVGERANDKQWLIRVVKYYSNPANKENDFMAMMESKADNDHEEARSGSGQTLLNKLLSPQRKRRKRKTQTTTATRN